MKVSQRRSLKTRQIGQVVLMHLIDGTAVAPVDSGADKAYVQSVVKNGTGDYTITYKEVQKKDIIPLGIVPVTPDVLPAVTAVSGSAITVEFTDAAGAAADADFYLNTILATELNYYF